MPITDPRVTTLSFHLAAIERALQIAEAGDAFPFLAQTIRWHLAQATTIAADDLAHCRRLLQGDQTR